MATLFILEYCRGLVSHLVLVWQCRILSPSKICADAHVPSGSSKFNSIAGRRTFVYVERRMAELLDAHYRIAFALLVGVVLAATTANIMAQDVDKASASNPEVAANQGSPASSGPAADPADDSVKLDPPVTPTASASTLSGNFFQRFGKAYLSDWNGSASENSGPEPKYRGYPPPVTNPPFPFTIWPYGGSVTIGYPWTQSGPLMQSIWSGRNGEAWKKSGVQIYGWVNGGFNVSTSTNGHYGNGPTAYDVVPNSFQADQQVLYIERQPDTVQTDHFDWGFRVATLYGLDYRYTTAKGWFSHQLLHTNPDGTIGYTYGVDPVMVYVDLYFPHVAEGMNVRIGRYISLPDIEAQLAPNNYTYSHSLLYTFDCYTQTGVNATVKLSNHWTVQAGVSPGCDIAPWVGGPEAKTTFNGCLGYTWSQGWDNLYFCDNSLNSGKYSYNNLQAFYLTWYHKFNSSWHSSTESWYQYERNTPNVNNPSASSQLILNANGAVCATAQQVTCYAPEWAVVNYLEKEINKSNYLSIRNEYFDDIRGQRTGFKTRYIEDAFSWGHWIGTTVLLRPELRYEHAFDAPAYNSGTRYSQFTAAGDVIFFF